MAASDVDVILCGICDAQHVSHVADYWCPECDEGLCSPCKNYHGVSKASRQHGIISIDDYKKLPAEICKIEQNCTEHDKKFQMFCPRHDKLCCIMCISEKHKECTGMFLIDEAIKSSRSSTLFDSLEKSLKEIKENLERVVKDREANLVVIKQQHLRSLNDIKDTKQKINSRLDELEKHILDNLNITKEEVKLKINTLLNKLSEKMKTIELLKANLMIVKEHGSDLQAFVGSKMLEKDINKELNNIQNISEDEGFSQLRLKCNIDDKIKDILSEVTAFGSITIEKSQSSIVIGFEQEKQAQIFSVVPPSTRLIDDITVSPSGNFKVPAGKRDTYITGSSVFPDGRMIFSDCFDNNRLVVAYIDGTLDTEIPLSPLYPFDVTCIDDKTVAVTTFSDNKILIVDTKTKHVSNTIKTGSCRGITYRQGQLLYCEKRNGIIALQLSNYKVFTLVKDDTIHSDWSYITATEANLYYTSEADTVKCYSLKGDKLWEYKNDSIMRDATGIAVDQWAMIYVTSKKNKCVVLLSSDGKHERTMVTEKEVTENSLVVNIRSNKLTVVNYNGNVLQFNIE
ncbi:unnamed protein product [Mytilus coruscus]|uniref:B box-type domain-containing protein n=1 Tax=Mytilus coruscus TaxID=42192 RepID=A0A6J8B8P1_MYTCO|nr:unnamed protein product [Mytilus coruscus]